MKRLRLIVWVPCLFLARGLVAQNLVPDPSFASGVSAWSTAPPGAVQFDSRTRHLGTGSALFSVTTGGTAALRTCLPATAGTTYAWGQSFNFPSGPATANIFWGLTFYSGAGCSGAITGSNLQPAVIPGPRDVWIDLVNPNVVGPPGTVSVSYSFNYLLAGSNQATLIDDVFFGPAGTIPAFQDVVHIPVLSRLAFVVLTLALVVAGLEAIRTL